MNLVEHDQLGVGVQLLQQLVVVGRRLLAVLLLSARLSAREARAQATRRVAQRLDEARVGVGWSRRRRRRRLCVCIRDGRGDGDRVGRTVGGRGRFV